MKNLTTLHLSINFGIHDSPYGMFHTARTFASQSDGGAEDMTMVSAGGIARSERKAVAFALRNLADKILKDEHELSFMDEYDHEDDLTEETEDYEEEEDEG